MRFSESRAVRGSLFALCAFVVSMVLPVNGVRAFPNEAPKVQEIIESVRSSAALYENLEMTATVEYTLFQSVTGNVFEGLVQTQKGELRCVYQDGKLFFRQDLELVTVPGKANREDTLQGYDGQTMRVLERGAIANIRNNRADDGRLILPHNLVAQDLVENFPIADYLVVGRTARRYIAFKDVEITATYDGDDVIDGLRCHRLKVFYNMDSWKDDTGPAVRFLWISPERNYFPVRSESHARGTRKPGGNPLRIGRVEDLRKIAPGVWFPFRVIHDFYMPKIDHETGKRRLANRRVFTFQKAELDPHYDISLFRDIPFPDGAFVYEIENDKIVRKYVKGGRNAMRPESKGTMYAVVTGLLLTLAAALFWILRRRWKADGSLSLWPTLINRRRAESA